MGAISAGLLSLLICCVHGFQFKSPRGFETRVRDPEREWMRLAAQIGADTSADFSGRSATGSATTKPKTTAASFPEYLRQPMNKYTANVFSPAKGAKELPDWANEILLVPPKSVLASWPAPETATATGRATRPMLIEMLCHIDRIYVRIRRVLFKTKLAYKGLKFGKCPVNQGTKDHYYFLYSLKTDCGQSLESQTDYLGINIGLRYDPDGDTVRESPINVPLQCKYHRLFHAYKVGFYPKLQGAVIFKPLLPKQSAVLVPVDDQGNEITGTKTYTLGQVMYFVAKRGNDTGSSENQRMYINKCFATKSQNPNPNSDAKQVIIDNQGCMVDGKVFKQSMFLTGSSRIVQKFSVSAFVFKGADSSSSQQLYMHCEVYVGKLDASPSAKACNYDMEANKWKELYGNDAVCECCNGTCPTAQPRASKKTASISSHSWEVDMSEAEPRSFDAEEYDLEDQSDYWEDEMDKF